MSNRESVTQPCVTIITVVRNGVMFLEETIKSVAALAYDNLEYFIIDGGSTDGTLNLVKSYEKNITWWMSGGDDGIYDAMNNGWKAASDDSFILFLGAGDRILSLPGHMGRYSQLEVIYGSVAIGEDTVFRPRSDFHLRFYNSLHHQALLINKRLHPDPPFDSSFRYYADFDLNQRLLKRGTRFVYDNTFQSFALPGGVTATLHIKESLAVIRKNFGAIQAGVALVAFVALRCFPLLRRFRPYVDKAKL